MHGITVVVKDAGVLKFIIFPSKDISYAYLKILEEDFKSLGYTASLKRRLGRKILIISDKVVIIGE